MACRGRPLRFSCTAILNSNLRRRPPADTLDHNVDAAAACPLLIDTQGRPAPQLGNLPDGKWRPAAPSARFRSISRSRPDGAPVQHQGHPSGSTSATDTWADADLATQIVRAVKKILLVPERASFTMAARPLVLPSSVPLISLWPAPSISASTKASPPPEVPHGTALSAFFLPFRRAPARPVRPEDRWHPSLIHGESSQSPKISK